MAIEIYDHWGIHGAMLSDSVRNEAFALALRSVVGPDSVVIDAGAGTGILSVLAAAAGARRIYAIEQSKTACFARRWVDNAGLNSRVTVIQGGVGDVQVPERADVVVSEWMGTFGVDENLLPMALIARDRWLKPGGAMLPSIVSARLALLGNTEAETSLGGRRNDRSLAWSRLGLMPEELLSEGATLWTTDTRTFPIERSSMPFRARVDLVAQNTGTVEALTAWFECELVPGVSLTNRPGAPATHWGQFVFRLPRPFPIQEGAAVKVRFDSIPAGPGFSHYAWSLQDRCGQWQHGDSRVPLLSACHSADEYAQSAVSHFSVES